MNPTQHAADKAHAHDFITQILHAQVHGFPLIGIIIVAFAAAAVISRLIKAITNLAVGAAIIIAIVVFAPTLFGKKHGAEVQQQARTQEQVLLGCKNQLGTHTAKSVLDNCVKHSEKAAAKSAAKSQIKSEIKKKKKKKKKK